MIDLKILMHDGNTTCRQIHAKGGMYIESLI